MKQPLFRILVLSSWMLSATVARSEDLTPLKIGWIGAMTGPIAKYGSYQSAQLAMEDINRSGGVNGRPIQLIFEDGKGDGRSAANAAQKLIGVDNVSYLVGGHCSPESLAIAPIAERKKVVMVAAITSNPKFTTAGDYVFRLTAVSTRHAEMIAPYVMQNLGLSRVAIVFEETEYARPPAERLRELVSENKGEVVEFQHYHPGETDFRTILTRLRSKRPEAVYLGVQSPDTAHLFLRQLKQLGFSSVLLGNEVTGNAVSSDRAGAALFEGMIFAEPDFDLGRAETKEFIERYRSRFAVDELPYGIWTAEAYDAVRLLAETIGRCGDQVESVKRCLYEVRNYQGVSASVSIDANGDGERAYVLKQIRDGLAVKLEAKSQ